MNFCIEMVVVMVVVRGRGEKEGVNKKWGGVGGGWIELQGGLMVFNQLFLFCLQCIFCN